MAWQDFDVNSALQRDTLERALPLVEIVSTDEWGAVLNLTGVGDPGRTTILLDSVVIGATPQACIDLLQLRPLLFGTAWTILDLLLEEALAAVPNPNGSRWTIEAKARQARAGAGRPTSIGTGTWQALMLTYAQTVELRHSLVHRAAFTDPTTQALIGKDRNGGQLRPVTLVEQDAFVRAVLRAAQLVATPVPEERLEDDLLYQLGLLAGVHQVVLGQVPQHLRLARITVRIPSDSAAPGRYRLDVPAIKARSPWPDATWTDLIVHLHDRPGQELRGRLEHAPDQVLSIDPAAPPTWLS